MSSITALAGISNPTAPTNPSKKQLISMDKNRQWQRELLMERIRSHSSQHKTFPELSKAMRMSMLEKRYALDPVEKSNLQKSLDSMQHCIKVTTRQGLAERLETLSRQLGMKFVEDATSFFISTDMFYLEIMLDEDDFIKDAKIHHECQLEQRNCKELVDRLRNSDFADLTAQLEGLSAIYQLNAETKIKMKAYVALQAMENDLYNLFQMHNCLKAEPGTEIDVQNLMIESTVGIATQRRAGHPMKLTYFMPPYDLISLENKAMAKINMELINSQKLGLGMFVTVNLEASSSNKLQVENVVLFIRDGVECNANTLGVKPVYKPLTSSNSMLLPATFVLRLNKPLPVSHKLLTQLLEHINSSTSAGQQPKASETRPPTGTIVSLIVQAASEQQIKYHQKGFYVCLKDMTHCYFFAENSKMQADMLSSISCTEPSQVPQIIEFLKSQALFYTLVSSCIRLQTKLNNGQADIDSIVIVEINVISFKQLTVCLQHPFEESLVTLEFTLDASSPWLVKCFIYKLYQDEDYALAKKLSRIARKTLSIPITIRALFRSWDQERSNLYQRSQQANSTGAGGGGANHLSICSSNAAIATESNINQGIKIEGGAFAAVSVPRQKNSIPGVINNAPANVSNFLKFKLDLGDGIASAPSPALTSTIAASANALNIRKEDFVDSGGGGAASGGNIGVAVSGVGIGGAGGGLDITDLMADKKPSHSLLDDGVFTVATKMATAITTAHMLTNLTSSPSMVSSSTASLSAASLTSTAIMSALATASPLTSIVSTDVKPSDIEIADKYKNIWMDKTPNLKNNQLSITPIAAASHTGDTMPQQLPHQNQQQSNVNDVKLTGGIEIIPLSQNNLNNIPASTIMSSTLANSATVVTTSGIAPGSVPGAAITITPIAGVGLKDGMLQTPMAQQQHQAPNAPVLGSLAGNSVGATSLKRLSTDMDTVGIIPSSSTSPTSSSSSSSSSITKEKKRKKKREDSPMGPPEKIFSRQNSPAGGGPTVNSGADVLSSTTTSGSSNVRKFSSPSSSPKAGSGGGSISSGNTSSSLISGLIGSGIGATSGSGSLSTRPSPKHSPAYSSPKHANTASNSPKSPFGTHSPKHGSSGKPSMSTLKSAAATSAVNSGSNTVSQSATVGSIAAASVSAAAVLKARNDKEKLVVSQQQHNPAAVSVSNGTATITLSTGAQSGSSAAGVVSAGIIKMAASTKAPIGQQQQPQLAINSATTNLGMTAATTQSQQQLKTSANLNQLLAGFSAGNIGGGNSNAGPSSTLNLSLGSGSIGNVGPGSDVNTAAAVVAVQMAAAMRKNMPGTSVGAASNISGGGLGGAGVGNNVGAVSLMSSALSHQQQQQLLPPPLQQQMQQQQQTMQQLPQLQLQLVHGSNDTCSNSNTTSSVNKVNIAHSSTISSTISNSNTMKSKISASSNSVPMTTTMPAISTAITVPTTNDTSEAAISIGGIVLMDDDLTASSSSAASCSSSSEYMVKTSSQEGLKLTINKTSTSACGTAGTGNSGFSSTVNSSSSSSKTTVLPPPTTSASSSTSATTPSPTSKKHTGLKPGVNSGPASKKSGANATNASPTQSDNLMKMLQYATNVAAAAAATTTTTVSVAATSLSASRCESPSLQTSAGNGPPSSVAITSALLTRGTPISQFEAVFNSSGGLAGFVKGNSVGVSSSTATTTGTATTGNSGGIFFNSSSNLDFTKNSSPPLGVVSTLLPTVQQQKLEQQQPNASSTLLPTTTPFMRSPPPSYHVAMAAAQAAAAAAAVSASNASVPCATNAGQMSTPASSVSSIAGLHILQPTASSEPQQLQMSVSSNGAASSNNNLTGTTTPSGTGSTSSTPASSAAGGVSSGGGSVSLTK